jgi:hypothetical protein
VDLSGERPQSVAVCDKAPGMSRQAAKPAASPTARLSDTGEVTDLGTDSYEAEG